MIYILLNANSILAAAAFATALGAIWYGKPSIGTGITLFAAQAWLGAILAGALILAPPKGGVWTMTLGSAFIIWIGFVLPALTASYRLRGTEWRTIGIDAGYWLAAMIIEAVVMRLIGLVPPPV
jgi:hypothetical protein